MEKLLNKIQKMIDEGLLDQRIVKKRLNNIVRAFDPILRESQSPWKNYLEYPDWTGKLLFPSAKTHRYSSDVRNFKLPNFQTENNHTLISAKDVENCPNYFDLLLLAQRGPVFFEKHFPKQNIAKAWKSILKHKDSPWRFFVFYLQKGDSELGWQELHGFVENGYFYWDKNFKAPIKTWDPEPDRFANF